VQRVPESGFPLISDPCYSTPPLGPSLGFSDSQMRAWLTFSDAHDPEEEDVAVAVADDDL
jgi:hypothetical protein